MSLRKRSSIWWIDIVGPDGRRIRRSTGTEHKALAQEYDDRLKAQLLAEADLLAMQIGVPAKHTSS